MTPEDLGLVAPPKQPDTTTPAAPSGGVTIESLGLAPKAPLASADGPGFLERFWGGMLGKDVSRVGRIGMGVADPPIGAWQLSQHIPQPVRDALSARPDEGPMARAMGRIAEPQETKPPADNAAAAADKYVQEREAGYEKRRLADAGGKPLLTDWFRIGGSVAGSLPLAAIPGGVGGGAAARIGTGALAGAAGAAAAPVTGGDYWAEKGKQSAVGGVLGAGLGAAGHLLRPTLSPEGQALRQSGVRTTMGQNLGGSFQDAERGLEMFPILRGYVQNRVERSVQDFDRAIAKQVLEPVATGIAIPRSVSGPELMKLTHGKLSDGFDRLLPRLAPIDRSTFVSAFTADPKLTRFIQEMAPDDAHRFTVILQNRVLGRFDDMGGMGGRLFKEVQEDLSSRSADFVGTNSSDVGKALRAVNTILRDVLETQNPTLGVELRNLNHAYAMYARMREAASRGATADGNFTPADLLAAIRSGDISAGHQSFAKGDGLLQAFATAGEKVIGKSLPTYHERLSIGNMLLGLIPGIAGVPIRGGAELAQRGAMALPGAIADAASRAVPLAGEAAASGLVPRRPEQRRQLSGGFPGSR